MLSKLIKLLIILNILINSSNANTLNVGHHNKFGVLEFDSIKLSIEHKKIEIQHPNGLKIILNGRRNIEKVVFINKSNDSLTIVTNGKYPSMIYKEINESFHAGAGKHYQKNVMVRSVGSSQFGNFDLKTYFFNENLEKLEIEYLGLTYTIMFSVISLNKYYINNIIGKNLDKNITAFWCRNKNNRRFLMIFHREQPFSVIMRFKPSGKVKNITLRENDNNGNKINETSYP